MIVQKCQPQSLFIFIDSLLRQHYLKCLLFGHLIGVDLQRIHLPFVWIWVDPLLLARQLDFQISVIVLDVVYVLLKTNYGSIVVDCQLVVGFEMVSNQLRVAPQVIRQAMEQVVDVYQHVTVRIALHRTICTSFSGYLLHSSLYVSCRSA